METGLKSNSSATSLPGASTAKPAKDRWRVTGNDDSQPPDLWFSLGQGKRPLLEHLEELRRRFLRSGVVVLVATALSFRYSDILLQWFLSPVGEVVFLNPVEPFLVHLKISFVAGLILSSPWLAVEVWGFLTPALGTWERRLGILFVPMSVGFFLLGASFGWKVLLPVTLGFLASFASENLIPMITVGAYTGFAGWLVLASGLTFQMPLIIAGLTRARLIRPVALIQQWRLALVGILIFSAIVTPTPDVITQIVLALPMGVLYGVSILLAYLVEKR